MDPQDPIDDRLDRHLDGDLSPAEEEALRQALADDPALAAELSELQALVGDLGSLAGAEAPADFTASVLAAVADEPIPGREPAAVIPLFRRARRPLLAMAAVLLVGLGLNWYAGKAPHGSSALPAPPAVAELRPAPSTGLQPTGGVEAPSDSDGVAALEDEDGRAALRARVAAEADGPALPSRDELMETPEVRVANGAVPAAPRHAARVLAPESAPAEGVFVAEFEREGEVAELDDEAADDEPSAEGDFAPEPPTRAAAPPIAAGFAARADAGAMDASSPELLAGDEGAAAMDASSPELASGSAGRQARSVPVASSFTAGATAQVGDPAAGRSLELELRRRGWLVQRVGANDQTIRIQVTVPADAEDALFAVLRGAGRARNLVTVPVDQGRRLDLTIGW